VLGGLIGATAVAVPGLGALLAAGALVGAIGAATGGIIGHLIEKGLTREEAQYYQERVRHGAVLMTVGADGDRADEAHAIMQRLGAHDYQTRPT
jgi:outer membrane lipoprotein SlyB